MIVTLLLWFLSLPGDLEKGKILQDKARSVLLSGQIPTTGILRIDAHRENQYRSRLKTEQMVFIDLAHPGWVESSQGTILYVSGFDGQSAWRRTYGQKEQVPMESRLPSRRECLDRWYQFFPIFLREKLTWVWLETNQDQDHVRLFDKERAVADVWLDSQGEVRALLPHYDGEIETKVAPWFFDDYRDVEGGRYPFKQWREGRRGVIVSIKRYRIMGDDPLFEPWPETEPRISHP